MTIAIVVFGKISELDESSKTDLLDFANSKSEDVYFYTQHDRNCYSCADFSEKLRFYTPDTIGHAVGFLKKMDDVITYNYDDGDLITMKLLSFI